MNIRFLYIVFVVWVVLLLGNCGTKRFVMNDNSCCTNKNIPKEKFVFNINGYNKLKDKNRDQIETFNKKNIKEVLGKYYDDSEYYRREINTKNKFKDLYRYDSLGRLIFKYSTIVGVNVGEEIEFKYKDAKSREPIEVYRVNYDLMYPICWKEALAIAKRKGINLEEITITMKMPSSIEERKRTEVWKIWDHKKLIHIDAYTGKVVLVDKPTRSQYQFY